MNSEDEDVFVCCSCGLASLLVRYISIVVRETVYYILYVSLSVSISLRAQKKWSSKGGLGTRLR